MCNSENPTSESGIDLRQYVQCMYVCTSIMYVMCVCVLYVGVCVCTYLHPHAINLVMF